MIKNCQTQVNGTGLICEPIKIYDAIAGKQEKAAVVHLQQDIINVPITIRKFYYATLRVQIYKESVLEKIEKGEIKENMEVNFIGHLITFFRQVAAGEFKYDLKLIVFENDEFTQKPLSKKFFEKGRGG